MPLHEQVDRHRVKLARINRHLPILAGLHTRRHPFQPAHLRRYLAARPARCHTNRNRPLDRIHPKIVVNDKIFIGQRQVGDLLFRQSCEGGHLAARITRRPRNLPATRSYGRDRQPAGHGSDIPAFEVGRPPGRSAAIPPGDSPRRRWRANRRDDALPTHGKRRSSRLPGCAGRTEVGSSAKGTPAPRQLAAALVQGPGASLTATPAPGFSGSERHAGLPERGPERPGARMNLIGLRSRRGGRT